MPGGQTSCEAISVAPLGPVDPFLLHLIDAAMNIRSIYIHVTCSYYSCVHIRLAHAGSTLRSGALFACFTSARCRFADGLR